MTDNRRDVIRAEEVTPIQEKEIVEYLIKLDVKQSLSGFRYLIETIAGRIDGTYTKGMCETYRQVAEKFKTEQCRVERAIRNAIKNSNTPDEHNREFISKAVNHFKYK